MSSNSDLTMSHLQSLATHHGSGSSTGGNTANSSPTDPGSGSLRPGFANGSMSAGNSTNNVRMGAGSPNYDASSGSRLFSKRAREIQAEEGVGPPHPPGLWGPMPTTSASSLRDRGDSVQESQPSNSFADNGSMASEYTSPVYRRARAGTVPSKFSPGGLTNAPPAISQILPQTSRPSPVPSPFKSSSPSNLDLVDTPPVSGAGLSTYSVASRLRSGSLNLPQRTNYVSAFGPSIFSSSWSQSRPGSNNLPSPAQSSFSKDDEGTHMAPKTLDYLGLVDTPQTSRATLAKPMTLDPLIEGQRAAALQPFVSDLSSVQRNINRIRSYSVNAKEKYAEDEEDDEDDEVRHLYSTQHSGSVTPNSMTAMAAAQAQANAHALAVAAYTNHASPSRPRARTAGILDSPPASRLKGYLATPSRLDSMTSASDMRSDYFDLQSGSDTLKLASLHPRPSSGEGGLASIEESSLEGPTRSLWLGNIPASTTTTSLDHIFRTFGHVESARVLTHKNCGFINFERMESAIQARNQLNGKEIFPGAGPVRIGFAKPSSAGSNGTPTPSGGVYGTPSPDPHQNPTAIGAENGLSMSRDGNNSTSGVNGKDAGTGHDSTAVPKVPELSEMKDDILSIVVEFGAEKSELPKMAKNIDFAIQYDEFEAEIPSIPEPSHNRVHDAPKLRDIRKRIDNGNCSNSEIEEIALNMLPEIAELSSG